MGGQDSPGSGKKNRAHTIRAAGVIFFFAIAWAVQMGLSDSGSSGSLAVAGQVHGNVDGARSGRTLLQEEETGNVEGGGEGPSKACLNALAKYNCSDPSAATQAWIF